jgi:hypothetical protein
MRTISILILSCACLSASGVEERLWLDAKINGEPVRLCFDTGSDRVALLREAAQRLGLKVTDPPSDETIQSNLDDLRFEGGSKAFERKKAAVTRLRIFDAFETAINLERPSGCGLVILENELCRL